MPMPTLRAREQRALRDFQQALLSSLSLKTMMADAFSFLTRLVPADRGALCVTKPDTASDYFWELANIPPSWFEGYRDLAEHDLVRKAVLNQPNEVLRESEIAPPSAFRENPWVQRSQDLGMSLTHVMSVMLVLEPEWHGGLTLYREQRSPFSNRQQQLLKELVPFLCLAIRNCRLFGEAVQQRGILEWLFQHYRGAELVVLTPSNRELMRTKGADALLAKWFQPHELRNGKLPSVLLDQFAATRKIGEQEGWPVDVWWDRNESENLKVTFVQLPPEPDQPRQWACVLAEVPARMPLPLVWRAVLSEPEREIFECWSRARPNLALKKRLTAREVEAALLIIDWQEAPMIAKMLGCSESTVRVHLHNICHKLGADNLAMLLYWVFRYR